MADQRAEAIIRDQERLAAARGNFEEQWEEIAERVIPRSARTFFTRGDASQGEKKTEKMLDSTAAIALERFASVMQSMITPGSQTWHRLRASLPELNRIPRVLRWFDEVNDRLFRYRYAPRANFGGQQAEAYVSVGAFGTGIKFTDWVSPTPTDPAGGLRYRYIHLSEAYLRENHQGAIDAVYRRFKLTARQVRQAVDGGRFSRMPDAVEKVEKSSPDQTFDFIHAVYPNAEYEEGRRDWRGMPWASHYVFVQGCEILSEGGEPSFPYDVGRNVVAPGEIYGRSPAMTVLPSIKVLNAQKAVHLKMGHRLVDPVLLAFDDGVIDGFSLKPGAINVGGVNGSGQRLVQRLDDNVGQIAQLAEMMQVERLTINDAFLVSIFQILVETPTMTATEVLERTREKAMLLAPTLGRYQNEALGTQIEREVDLLARANRLPPPPPELIEAAGDYTVIYDNPLNRAMKAEELAGFQRWVETALAAAQATGDPAPVDWVDFDTAMPEAADYMAVPPRWVRLREQVDAIREGRAQAAEMQAATQALPAAASMIKALAPQGMQRRAA